MMANEQNNLFHVSKSKTFTFLCGANVWRSSTEGLHELVSSLVHIQQVMRDIFQMVPSVDMLTYKQFLIPAPYIITWLRFSVH
jgi:hypothetical protein